MSGANIHQVININGFILIVFYTNARCWQFRVVSPDGGVYGERKIYYSAEAAEKAGREWVGRGK